MPGDNPLVPAFPDIVFVAFIVLFVVVALAIVGGSIAVTVVLVRRANSGQPLQLQAPVRHPADPFFENQIMHNSLAQQQLAQQQQQLLFQQQTQINNNIVNGL